MHLKIPVERWNPPSWGLTGKLPAGKNVDTKSGKVSKSHLKTGFVVRETKPWPSNRWKAPHMLICYGKSKQR